MRVCFVLPSLQNKGPVIVAKNIAEYLVVNGIYCEVFYLSEIVELSFPCKTTKISFFDFDKISSFDIVHTHGLRPDLFSFISPVKRVRRVTTLHSYIKDDFRFGLGFSKLKTSFFVFLWCVLLVRMDKVVVLSKNAIEYYRHILFKTSNLEYVYNGVSVIKPKRELLEGELLSQIATRFKIIGTVSVLTKIKGLKQVIEVLPGFNDVFFVVVGDGPEKDNLIKLSRELQVDDRCLFLGYKDNATDYLPFFDFFIFPSYSEGFGLSLIEAAASKRPCVVSDIPIFRELFDESQVSFVELDNNDSMEAAISKVIKDGHELSMNMYSRFKRGLTLEAMGEGYLRLYRKLLCD